MIDGGMQSEIEDASPEKSQLGAIVLEYSDENALIEKKLRRKFDLRILPIVTGIFLLAFIDRYDPGALIITICVTMLIITLSANSGNARLLGMADDLDLEGYRFNVAMTVFYVSYVLLEM
jgi:hypothetical protein